MIDYKKWKKNVFELYSSRFDMEYVQRFMRFIGNRYDKLNKNYLPHGLMWRAYDIHNKVSKNQHQVYGCVGRGGYGKSTLIKNVLYFHDPTFNQERIASTMDRFQEVLYNVLKMRGGGKYKAILIDEPSKETHSSSKEWRMTEDLLGQIRQNNLFIGVCSTNLKNIKPSVYSLITGLFAFRKHFIYDYYDEEKTEGITGEIRKRYDQTGTYDCLHDYKIIKKACLRNYYSIKTTPIDSEQKEYDREKKRQFINKLRRLYELREKDSKKVRRIRRDNEICRLHEEGNLTQIQIAKRYNLTPWSINQIIKKFS